MPQVMGFPLIDYYKFPFQLLPTLYVLPNSSNYKSHVIVISILEVCLKVCTSKLRWRELCEKKHLCIHGSIATYIIPKVCCKIFETDSQDKSLFLKYCK